MPDPDKPSLSPAPTPALPAAGPDEVALLVDGRPVVVKKGTTVLQAALTLDTEIPHFCYHAGLSIAGNCRMCLIEIEKVPKLQIGCATTVAQGMSVKTSTDRVRRARQGIMEFELINHPLDCPICDQAGECSLQKYEHLHGLGHSRFAEAKNHFPKRYDIGPHVMFDAERCIKCTRCIRFCDEISRSHELTVMQRGDQAIIATFPGRALDNPYSGCTVDVCPVGALTLKEFRFKARVWFLKDVPSVCAGCARGCSVNLAAFENRIHRITPRENPEVNRFWICDAGRLSHLPPAGRPPLETTRAVREEALDRAAALLRGVRERSGPAALAAILSARLTAEDLYVARRVLETLGIERVAVPPHEEGEDDALLIRRDKTPNARGAALLGAGAPNAGRVKEILEDAAKGRVRGLVVIGEDPVGEGLARADALRSLEALVVIDSWRSPTAEAAHVALPSCAYGEYEGVFVNFEGRAQRARQAIKPRAEADPVWSLLADLGGRLGMAGEYRSAATVFDEIAARVPAFAGLSYRALGTLGAALKGA
jgi:NADH-quinone oxidoreductase subunit G